MACAGDEPRRSGAALPGLTVMKALPLFRPQSHAGSGGSAVNVLDCAEDHRRGTPD
jgi:hypothetical protein